jgi:hypothetical protein
MQLFVALLCSLLFRPPRRAQTSLSTLSSNTLSQCSSLMYRPSSTPIQHAQQVVTVSAVFRHPTTRQPTVPGITTVSSVPSCFVVALQIAYVVPKYLNCISLSCIAFARHEYFRVLGLLSIGTESVLVRAVLLAGRHTARS